MARMMTGGEMVIQALADQGVEYVFGYPGGAVLPIYDELFQQDKVKHILVRQEGGAVHAAEGYARSTGKVGVVLVTSRQSPPLSVLYSMRTLVVPRSRASTTPPLMAPGSARRGSADPADRVRA